MSNKPTSIAPRQVEAAPWLAQFRRASLVAAAVAACWALPANALTLSNIRVSSALGEPLRAEIDLSQASEDELSSLTAAVAGADAYKTAGMEYSASLASVVISLQKQADGRATLVLRSDRAVNDPFVDMIVEVNWATGRIVRDYTLLLDPKVNPGNQSAIRIQTPVVGTSPVMSSSSQAGPKAATGTVTVKAGDTAGKIAAAHMQAGVSLEQMLASMLSSNPEAFIGGDINRIKAGAIIQTPDAAAASQIAPAEAHKMLVASSKNFGEYRQRAALVTTKTTSNSDRQSSGQIQAKVEDKSPVSSSSDKLRLSQAQVKGGTTAADSLAKKKAAADSQARSTEISKNLSDLSKVSSAASAATGTAATTKAGIPVAASTPVPATTTLSASSTVTTTVTAVASPTSTSTVTSVTAAASAASASTATAAPAKPKPKAPPPPPPEPSFLDQLTSEPIYAVGAVGLLAALLGGLLFWRKRRNAGDGNVDSSFLASRLQPDSFFSGSGGQQVNTTDGDPNTGSSMMYSPSQLDAGGDVDPVAEAEVYIAYGRDLQAEEILKEALRTQGNRPAIHVKLLEIYAKRRDTKAFDLVAREVYSLTNGKGQDWDKVCQIGRDLNPDEPMYRPGGKPSENAPKPVVDSSIGGSSFADSTEPPPTRASGSMPLDLNLDAIQPQKSSAASGRFESTIPLTGVGTLSARDSAVMPKEPTQAAKPEEKAPAPTLDNSLSFDLESLSLDLKPAAADAKPADTPVGKEATSTASPTDPMETKLQLAAEFHALGDVDSARALAQEVVNQAEGEAKAKAQRLLGQWS